MEFLKLGQSYQIGLVLTQFFLTQPFHRYSTSNMTQVPPLILIENPDVDLKDIIGDAIPVLWFGNAAIMRLH